MTGSYYKRTGICRFCAKNSRHRLPTERVVCCSKSTVYFGRFFLFLDASHKLFVKNQKWSSFARAAFFREWGLTWFFDASPRMTSFQKPRITKLCMSSQGRQKSSLISEKLEVSRFEIKNTLIPRKGHYRACKINRPKLGHQKVSLYWLLCQRCKGLKHWWSTMMPSCGMKNALHQNWNQNQARTWSIISLERISS